MNAFAGAPDSTGGTPFDHIAQALATDGVVLLPDALPPALIDALFVHLTSIPKETFADAGIGRDTLHQTDRFVRTDKTLWIDAGHPATAAYLEWAEQLRRELNRRLFLGLFDFECHFAWYPAGAYYRRHVDAFKGDTNRVLTVVLYLNPNWSTADGGELLLYRGDAGQPVERVLPAYGQMAIFLSEDFPHEVVAARRSRYSLTGWFRVHGPGPFA